MVAEPADPRIDGLGDQAPGIDHARNMPVDGAQGPAVRDEQNARPRIFQPEPVQTVRHPGEKFVPGFAAGDRDVVGYVVPEGPDDFRELVLEFIVRPSFQLAQMPFPQIRQGNGLHLQRFADDPCRFKCPGQIAGIKKVEGFLLQPFRRDPRLGGGDPFLGNHTETIGILPDRVPRDSIRVFDNRDTFGSQSQ